MKKLEWVEAMRGFAALWVLAHHSELSVSHFVGSLGPVVALHNGYLGVDFFFVLSGFIIALSCDRLLEDGAGLRRYARARATRIYVPYLPVGVAMLVAYALLPGLSESERAPGLLTSLTLLPSNSPPALSVAWTLVHEVLFYVLFSLVFVSRRLLHAALVAWVVLIVGVYFADVPLPRVAQYFLSPLNLCFVLGVAVHRGVRRGVTEPQGIAALAVGGALVAFQALATDPNRILIALGFAGLIVAAASPLAGRARPARGLVTLGAASYAIYLVHGPAVAVLARIVPVASPWLAMAIVATAATLAGLAYHLGYERHALRLTSTRRSGPPGIPMRLPDQSVAGTGQVRTKGRKTSVKSTNP